VNNLYDVAELLTTYRGLVVADSAELHQKATSVTEIA